MCIYCRDTDELCAHTAPAATADGRGYTIAAGTAPTWADLAHPSPSYLLGLVTAALDSLARHEAALQALEIMVLALRDQAHLSGEP